MSPLAYSKLFLFERDLTGTQLSVRHSRGDSARRRSGASALSPLCSSLWLKLKRLTRNEQLLLRLPAVTP